MCFDVLRIVDVMIFSDCRLEILFELILYVNCNFNFIKFILLLMYNKTYIGFKNENLFGISNADKNFSFSIIICFLFYLKEINHNIHMSYILMQLLEKS